MDPGSALGRRRPRLHFTPRTGWLNDPYGVVHADGRYHLYYQHNPAGTAWDTATAWGHATSRDLVIWSEQPVALSPADGEVGCWTGSVVLGPDGPTLFYTRSVDGDPALAQVVRATSADFGTWRRDPTAVVIAEPPPGVAEMRDPAVWSAPDGWRMVLGARLDEGAAALQYRSADTRTWHYDGVVATSRAGTTWECPQLFPLDGVWVLIVSVDDGVRYAVGDYDGRTFTARTWGDFGRGRLMYATTTFLDAAGRRCAMSWLRERDDRAPAGSPWAGALSIPWVLSVRDNRLFAAPHPHLDRYLTDGGLALRVDGGRLLDGDEVLLDLPPGGEVTVIVDADLVEVAVEGVAGLGTARLAYPGDGGAHLLRFASAASRSRPAPGLRGTGSGTSSAMPVSDLRRFVDAQEGVYPDALAEIRAGDKRGHWMWFVFPQLAGLGSSPTAQRYALSGLAEARAYLADPVLGPRLRESTAAVLTNDRQIFGFPDDLKLRSSMTLFAEVADDPAPFRAVLDRFYDGPDPRTLQLLGR